MTRDLESQFEAGSVIAPFNVTDRLAVNAECFREFLCTFVAFGPQEPEPVVHGDLFTWHTEMYHKYNKSCKYTSLSGLTKPATKRSISGINHDISVIIYRKWCALRTKRPAQHRTKPCTVQTRPVPLRPGSDGAEWGLLRNRRVHVRQTARQTKRQNSQVTNRTPGGPAWPDPQVHFPFTPGAPGVRCRMSSAAFPLIRTPRHGGYKGTNSTCHTLIRQTVRCGRRHRPPSQGVHSEPT